MVAIIIVNYNTYDDTLECVESILKSDYDNYKIFIVDNSTDKSKQEEFINKLKNLSGYIRITENLFPSSTFFLNLYNKIFLHTTINKGFATANNEVIKKILFTNAESAYAYNYFWILNNDTVIERDTLSKYLNEFEKLNTSKNIGILGCLHVYYNKPEIIQGLGGCYNKFTGISNHLFDGVSLLSFNKIKTRNFVVDYPMGASLMISKDFFLDIGLMNELYFLYFEELDLVYRGRKKGWDFKITSRVKIKHKAGRSLLNKSFLNKDTSPISDFFSFRNRIYFTSLYLPYFLPSVIFFTFLIMIKRIFAGRLGFIKYFLLKK